MAKYSVPLVCWGRSFNGILRSLPLKVVFSTSLNMVVSGITRCHWAWNWRSWCLMTCLAIPEIRSGSRQLTSLCPVAELAFAVFGFLSYQRSHYMVALGNVESWLCNSGTWLTSAQQGVLVSEGRLQTVGSISSTELQSVHRAKQLLPSALLAFMWQVRVYFSKPRERKSFHHRVPYWISATGPLVIQRWLKLWSVEFRQNLLWVTCF